MVLASQSPRRIELMREAGFSFSVCPADIDEAPRAGEDPIALVARLSREKALAVAAGGAAAAGELVIAADTVVALDGQALGKPVDAADAHRMLRALSGRTHQVYTGVCVARSGQDKQTPETFVEATDVTFYELADDEVDAYVASGEPMDKAGAYGIQGSGGRLLVNRIEGDFYNVVGLPIARLTRLIRHLERKDPL